MDFKHSFDIQLHVHIHHTHTYIYTIPSPHIHVHLHTPHTLIHVCTCSTSTYTHILPTLPFLHDGRGYHRGQLLPSRMLHQRTGPNPTHHYTRLPLKVKELMIAAHVEREGQPPGTYMYIWCVYPFQLIHCTTASLIHLHTP